MTKRTRRALGGSTPAEKVSLGRSLAVRPGKSPGEELATGTALAKRLAKGGRASKGVLKPTIRQTGPHHTVLLNPKGFHRPKGR